MKFIKKILVKILLFIVNAGVKDITAPAFAALAKPKLRPQQTEFAGNLAKLISYAMTLPNYAITIGEVERTKEQQAIYVAKGLSKTSNSKHLIRLAADLFVFINGEYRTDRSAYQPLADYWKTLHPRNVSGCDWGWDYNHFQQNPL